MPDLAMRAGEDSYPWPEDYVEEARIMGISKQIPKTAIPEIEPGKTRMAIIHPKGKIAVSEHSLIFLGLELVNEHVAGVLDPPDANKIEMVRHWLTTKETTIDDWKLAYVYENLVDPETGDSRLGMCELLRVAEMKKDLGRLEDKYGIKYLPAFIGFSYITGMIWVAGSEDDELPEDLQGLGIEPVLPVYEEEVSE